MTPEESRFTHVGLRIVSAHLSGNHEGRDQLIEKFMSEEEFPRLTEAFVYVALVGASLLAEVKDVPFQEALQSIPQLEDVSLWLELPVGPWEEIVRLAGAVQRSHDEARKIRPSLTMDVPGAINISFRLAVSALTSLTLTSKFSHMSPAALADMLARGIEDGHA